MVFSASYLRTAGSSNLRGGLLIQLRFEVANADFWVLKRLFFSHFKIERFRTFSTCFKIPQFLIKRSFLFYGKIAWEKFTIHPL